MNKAAANFFGVMGILGVLVLLRYPLYFNWESYVSSDDAFQALALLDLLEGSRFFFYHEGASYIGILPDLAALPFFWVMGVSPLAYTLPGVIFYALYIGSLYALVRKINPAAAWIAVFLVLLSPPEWMVFAARNMPHVILAFLGNLMFLRFIKIKQSQAMVSWDIFLLGFLIGLSIYNYTLSFVHVAVVLLVFVLTFQGWEVLREKFDLSLLTNLFRNLKTKKEFLVRGLDLLIGAFIAANLFSAVWGGFGLKFASVTVVQLNNLHKGLLQLLILVCLRVALDRSGLRAYAGTLLVWLKVVGRNAIFRLTALGFLAGISPRLLSILTGQTYKGGQGFHVEFNPVDVLPKLWTIFSETLPQTFGLWGLAQWQENINLFAMLPANPSGVLRWFMNLLVTVLILLAARSAISSQWDNLKRTARLREFEFSPVILLLLYPLILIILSVLSQGPPAARYFIVLHGMVLAWVALYLAKISKRSIILLAAVLCLWSGFYLSEGYRFYQSQSVMDGMKVVKKKEPLFEVIEFCASKQIDVAYAAYWVAYKTTFLSGRRLTVAEYYRAKEVRGKILKAKTLSASRFAIITRQQDIAGRYRDYLSGNNIGYRGNQFGIYTVLWEFEGNREDIDRLRDLI